MWTMDLGLLLHHVGRTLCHPDSEAKLWIYKYAEIGPVLDVKVVCHLWNRDSDHFYI